MSHRTDEELIDGSVRGDQSAFAELVRRYQRRVAVTIRGVIGDATTQETEDLAQDIFLLVYRSLPSFRGESGFGTYLTRIALRHCWRAARKRSRKSAIERPLGIDESTDAEAFLHVTGAAADDLLLREESRLQVRHALARLPDEFRLVLLMRIVEEMPVEQVAEILGISVGTVKSRLHRAREKMRDLLTGLD